MFHTNNNPPKQMYQGEAAKALILSSGLSVGLFSMAIFGGCWINDISTLQEFSQGVSGFLHRHGIGQDISTIIDDDDNSQSISEVFADIDK